MAWHSFLTGLFRRRPVSNDWFTRKRPAGELLTFVFNETTLFRFRWAPPGSFAKRPLFEDAPATFTQVKFSRGFWIAETLVTQAQYGAVVGLKAPAPELANLPMAPLSIPEVNRFCETLTAFGHKKRILAPEQRFDLPNVAQWEYAARAGTVTRWPFGDDIKLLPEYDWFADNSEGRLHPVAELKPNAWNLYDLLGNASEWRYETPPFEPSGLVVDPPSILPHPMAQQRFYSVSAGNYAASAFTCQTENNFLGEYDNLSQEPIGLRLVCVDR